MRFLSPISILFLVVLALIPSPVFAVYQHECASPVPPTVPGPLVQPPAIQGDLLINEVLLQPGSVWNCSEANTSSSTNDMWLEIYNTQNQSFDLYSAHVSIDRGPNTRQYYLPFGACIAANSFLTIFPKVYYYSRNSKTQTFRLLVNNIVVDEVTVPFIGKDQSYARIPDGSSNWFISDTPTIDASNVLSVGPPLSRKAKVEATATARALQKQAKSSHHAGSSRGGNTDSTSSDTGTNNGQRQDDGTPISWSSLSNHGNGITATPTAPVQPVTPVASNNDMDISHKVLLTVLSIAFALSLFWCWRLFRFAKNE